MYWTIHFEEHIVTEKPFTQESFSLNNLRVERKNTFPNLREGDSHNYFYNYKLWKSSDWLVTNL